MQSLSSHDETLTGGGWGEGNLGGQPSPDIVAVASTQYEPLYQGRYHYLTICNCQFSVLSFLK